MNIQTSVFGMTLSGEEVTKYTLSNDQGYSVSIINYGGIITELLVPNKDGIIENVVLGHNDMKGYYEASPFFGALTGRFAGRISKASFSIDDKTYTLPKNNNENCLHGGLKGFDKVIWSASQIVDKDFAGLTLNYLSEDMEEGFPGNLDTTVIYKWNNDNELSITYKATTDKETLVTVTNHTYFNLSGDLSSTILDHKLMIDADRFIEIGSDLIPCGISEVDNTPFDFRTAKEIGKDINSDNIQLKYGSGYDHPFMLNGNKNPQIVLYHEASGRKMEISTDEKCVVCYTGNSLDKITAYDSIPLRDNGGVCLETQYYPDNANFDLVPVKTLKPNELYKQTTVFKFSAI